LSPVWLTAAAGKGVLKKYTIMYIVILIIRKY
jgi:hypothetical protein